ncbi:MAG: hypothetical protein ACOY4U_12380 [Pseudomonadota bacterium]|jgi:hypothetical protein
MSKEDVVRRTTYGAVAVSVMLYLASLSLPAAVMGAYPFEVRRTVVSGLEFLGIGWLGVYFLCAAWLANLAIIVAWISLTLEKVASSPWWSVGSLILMLDTFRFNALCIPANKEGGGCQRIYEYSWGFYLWVASAVVLTVASVWRRFVSLEERRSASDDQKTSKRQSGEGL